MVERIAKENNIVYYDMLSDLKNYGNVNELYLDNLDDHFSIKGNQYAAELIANFLQRNFVIPLK